MTMMPSQASMILSNIDAASRARRSLRANNPQSIDTEELRRRRAAILANMEQTDLRMRQARMDGDEAGALQARQEFDAIRRERNDIDRELQPIQTPEQVMAARERLQAQVPGAIDSGIRQLQGEESMRRNRIVENQRRLALGESRSAYGVQNPPDDFLDTMYAALPADRRAQLNRGVPEGDARLDAIPGEIAALRARRDQPIDFGPVPQRDPASEAARRLRLMEAQEGRRVTEARAKADEARQLRMTDAEAQAAESAILMQRDVTGAGAEEAARLRASNAATAGQRTQGEIAGVAGGNQLSDAERRAKIEEAETRAVMSSRERRAIETGDVPVTQEELAQLGEMTAAAEQAATEIASVFGVSGYDPMRRQAINSGAGARVSDLGSPEVSSRVSAIEEVAARIEDASRSQDANRVRAAKSAARRLLASLPVTDASGSLSTYMSLGDMLPLIGADDVTRARSASALRNIVSIRSRLERLVTSGN